MKLLFELRPALAGYSGIPQESRLLFHALQSQPGWQVDGLLPPDALADVRLGSRPRSTAAHLSVLAWRSALAWARTWRGAAENLRALQTNGMEAALWQRLFSKALPADHGFSGAGPDWFSTGTPAAAAHLVGAITGWRGHGAYPRLDTRGYAVMLAQTPFPGRVSPGTRLVVRYHDAVPALLPRSVRKGRYARWGHLQALKRNLADGAWFACVSEATRHDLLALVPAAQDRSFTVHNIVSPYFFNEGEEAGAESLAHGLHHHGPPMPWQLGQNFLLMVGTLEPRKDHLLLLDAWEQAEATLACPWPLVLVGSRGWRSRGLMQRLQRAVASRRVLLLDEVAPPLLRLLYRNACATVCPSLLEGFGYPGIESLACGGVVVASDIAAHREVYGSHARYFPVGSAPALARLLLEQRALGAAERQERAVRGAAHASQYKAGRLLPAWQAALQRVMSAPP